MFSQSRHDKREVTSILKGGWYLLSIENIFIYSNVLHTCMDTSMLINARIDVVITLIFFEGNYYIDI